MYIWKDGMSILFAENFSEGVQNLVEALEKMKQNHSI